jgi:RNA polymerase-binding protein DksA
MAAGFWWKGTGAERVRQVASDESEDGGGLPENRSFREVRIAHLQMQILQLAGTRGTVMKIPVDEMRGVREILERKEAELARILGRRDGIAIERSADQMDEIQYASERDLAIGNVDREYSLLRDVKAALQRIHSGSFGTCIECELPISPKRQAALPWALRCIDCQETADRDGRTGGSTDDGDTFANVA